MVLFGGDTAIPVCGQTPPRTHVGDTWLLETDCGSWTQLSPQPAPSARARHAMATDAARDRALLFGGRSRPSGSTGPYTLHADVWAFDFGTRAWSPVATTGTPPSARSNSAMAVLGDDLVVFGGSTSTSGLTFTPQSDAWALDLRSGAWRALATTGGPPPARLFHAVAAEPGTRRLFVFGGGDENAFQGPFFSDLWVLDLEAARWHAVAAQNPVDADVGRIKPGLAVRAGGSHVLFLFAGHDDGALGNRNDLLLLDLGAPGALPYPGVRSWSTLRTGDVYNRPASGPCSFPTDFALADLASPERRSAFAFAPLPSGGAFLVFGGDSDCGRLNDAWWFDTGAASWTPVRLSVVGVSCARSGSTSCSSLCN
jgi:hypothetical protein